MKHKPLALSVTAAIDGSTSFIDASNAESYTAETECQKGRQEIRVLVPDNSKIDSWNKDWMAPTLDALMRLIRQPVDGRPKREHDRP